jgi:ATP-binding cassette subfamily C protein CydD
MDKRLLSELSAVRAPFVLAVALNAGIGLVVLAQAALLSRIINRVFLEKAAPGDVADLFAALAGVVLLRALLAGITAAAAGRTAIRIKADFRRRLTAHLVALGPAYTQNERSGELVAAATEGIERLDAFFREYLPALTNAVFVPVAVLVVVLPMDALTFFVMLVTAPLIPLFMVLIGKAAGVAAKHQYAQLGQLSAHFLDVMQGLTTLKLFNRSQYQAQTIARITAEFHKATMAVLRIAFLSAFTLEMLATLSVAVIAVEIGLRLLNGSLHFEQALFLLVIAPEYYLPLRALGAKFHAGTESTAAAARIYAVLETPLPGRPAASTDIPSVINIRFEDVSFAYDDGARPALNGVTLDILAGQRVALVGASGGGKSTVAALLLKFTVPDKGKITIDGMDLAGLDAAVWRRQIGWVSQSPYLFNASVADNIRLGQPDCPPECVMAAARAAEAHEFIIQLPQGYDTLCGERGLRLSGGQAQRIAIARAFLKDAPLLVLDEATANLDPVNEAAITATLRRLAEGRTTLIVAHRLNTILDADNIIVLDAGRVVEQGTQDTLQKQNGVNPRGCVGLSVAGGLA